MSPKSPAAPTPAADGPARLALLRAALAAQGLAGFLVPRADAHQGEFVAPKDERLAWLASFTGSAGLCVVLPRVAGLFVDGRYRLQARAQVADAFTLVDWPENSPGAFIAAHLAQGRVGFDPWLHTADEVDRLRADLAAHPVELVPAANPIDALWSDRPAPPAAAAVVHPLELAGQPAGRKRAALAEALRRAGQRAAVLTLPDSIAWLLNIRGADVPRNPVVQGFAILHDDGRVGLFAEPAKFADAVRAHLGPDVTIAPADAFLPALGALTGPVRLDRATAPLAVAQALEAAGVASVRGDDPCRLPKARKNAAEIAGMRAAHRRDGAAMCAFLCWLDAALAGTAGGAAAGTAGGAAAGTAGGAAAGTAGGARLTELDVVRALEGFRRATGCLHDLSFETIAGAGPNGAVIHYRPTEATNRAIGPDEVLLVDSGGQYPDGTTDITRTVAVGDPGEAPRAAGTRVLQGLIAISRLRWPRGLAGQHLDALARYPLWLAGQDYDHGTGHGVGAFLCVHEGPQRLSRLSDVPLEEGMILSNEPGYYRAGAFGIRLENLVVVTEAAPLPGADDRAMLAFETLTLAPFDRRLILADRLSADERAWLDAYHARVASEIGPRLAPAARDWLERACAPL